MTKKPYRVVLVGGGSGGHFYPLMGVAEELRQGDDSIDLYYMGPSPYDSDALRAQGIRFISCPAGKRRRYASPRNVLDLFISLVGICVALLKLYAVYPDVIFSKGGHTSVPVVLAAAFLRIPIVIHESDSVPGAANTLAARFAILVCTSYKETASSFPRVKVLATGIPIRKELLAPPLPQNREALGITNDVPTILIIGGSQGAERVNELILDSLDELLPDFNVIHQTGKGGFEVTALSARELIPDTELLSRYHPVPFMDAVLLNEAMHAADIVVSRAGSGSIHEIAVHGKPAILIPIPEEISHDQRTNAYTYARSGGAIVMEEKNLKDSLLRTEIDRIMADTALYERMSQGAFNFAPRDGAMSIARALRDITHTH